MGNILDPLLRTPNQVQKVRGFAEKAGDITIQLQTVKVQKSYPEAKVEVFYHSDTGLEVPAPRFDENGDREPDNFVFADENAFYEMYLETGYYDLKFSDLGQGVDPFKIPLKAFPRRFSTSGSFRRSGWTTGVDIDRHGISSLLLRRNGRSDGIVRHDR